jgi:formiminoglutamase
MEEKTIEKYTIFGLHESYNNQQILDFLRREIVPHWTFEQYLDSPEEIRQQFIDQIKKVPKANPTCLDIDLDSIAFMPSSAFTPSGFGTDEIRKLVRSVSSQRKINSLHLPEGAPNGKEEAWYGKFISYLICDFIKTQNLK